MLKFLHVSECTISIREILMQFTKKKTKSILVINHFFKLWKFEWIGI